MTLSDDEEERALLRTSRSHSRPSPFLSSPPSLLSTTSAQPVSSSPSSTSTPPPPSSLQTLSRQERREEEREQEEKEEEHEMGKRVMFPLQFGKKKARLLPSSLPPLPSVSHSSLSPLFPCRENDTSSAVFPHRVPSTAPSRKRRKEEDNSDKWSIKREKDSHTSFTMQLEEAVALCRSLCSDHHIPCASNVTIGLSAPSEPASTAQKLKQKPVTALVLHPQGNWLWTGSMDAQIRLYDFSRLNVTYQPTLNVAHAEQQGIIDLACNRQGDSIVCASLSSSLHFYQPTGQKVYETIKGDRYLLDQKRTSGHTASITAVRWHPSNDNVLFSSGRDGVIRQWQMAVERNVDVLKMRGVPARGLALSALDVSRDGKRLVAAASDGSLRLYDAALPVSVLRFQETSAPVIQDTSKGSCAACVKFHFFNTHSLFVRGGEGEDNVKIWDLRKTKTPIATISGLGCGHEQSDLDLSPDASLLAVTCASGQLAFIDLHPAQPAVLGFLPIADKSLIRVRWQSSLNQIFVSSASGNVHVLYDQQLSRKGVVLTLGRAAKKPRETVESLPRYDQIITPHALPLFRPDTECKPRRLENSIMEAHVPKKLSESQREMRHLVNKRVNPREIDPVEALRSVHDVVKADHHFNLAYSPTQPKTLFLEDELQDGKS